MKYKVERNRCGCHPETCCCDDYAVIDPLGGKYVTTNDKNIANQIVVAMNAFFRL